MYGLVNRALQGLVVSRHGDAAWMRIAARAHVDDEVFLSNEQYPDEVTYTLVGEAAAELGRPAEEILHDFGEYWVLHTARESYPALMEAGGASFPDFMLNLPNLHTRVTLLYPELRPPRFVVRHTAPDTMHLEYHSHRAGLLPFLLGLLHGLGEHFGVALEVEVVAECSESHPYDELRVRWAARTAA